MKLEAKLVGMRSNPYQLFWVLAQYIFAILVCTFCWKNAIWASSAQSHPVSVIPEPVIIVPKTHFDANDLAIVINDADPLSLKIGNYYQNVRHIPSANIIHIRFTPGVAALSYEEFAKIKSKVYALTPKNVQAYVLTWTAPYRVGCMSITTAFAAGYDKAYCSQKCGTTKLINYYNSNSKAPYTDFRLRPTISLAGLTFKEVKELIDRGLAADHTFPKGTAYLLSTTSGVRNVRAQSYPNIIKYLKNSVKIEVVKANYIEYKNDIMFYFTGLTHVPGITSNRFIPGAIADHLTSTGGVLSGENSQMSSLRWLEAGATGSYGTVVEPCNIPGKFPHPGVVMSRYLQGETLIEAYWKSVAMPGQGIFIGEPLANPYSGSIRFYYENKMVAQTPPLARGVYMLLSSDNATGPYKTEVFSILIISGAQKYTLNEIGRKFYKLVKVR